MKNGKTRKVRVVSTDIPSEAYGRAGGSLPETFGILLDENESYQ
jgi:hypothetical protein